MKNKKLIFLPIALFAIVLLNILASFFFFRIDLTSEKRFSLSDNTKKMMKSLDKPVNVIIYLDGDLNPGFLKLRKSTEELLQEMDVYANKDLTYEFVNPSAAATEKERNETYTKLEGRGLHATVVYDKDEEGKAVQKVVFPWAVIVYGNDSIPVRLLQNNPQFTGEENLNHSAENLEYVFADALRVRLQKSVDKVAFIEGHGELLAEDVYDASVTLSKYFQVDRGALGYDASVLDGYKAIIVAGPKAKFNEREKFIIDQYIMNGGRVLWMLDGVRLANDSLSTVGMSPAIPLDLNISDQLFRYGVRIVPAILEDMQCVQVPMNVAKKGEQPQYEAMPFYYSPLLLASPESPVTKNIVEVKANFASGIDLNVSNGEDVKKSVLLATSNATHVEPTPTRIDLSSMYDMDSKTYFNQHYMPVAALVEGTFSSIYTNRMAPDSVTTTRPFMAKSKNTRMIFVANSEIIRNDIVGTQANPQIVPLGYDRYTGREFGNRNFIVNSVLYLTDDEGWLQLRSREFKLRLLNKVEIIKNKTFFQVVNVILPVLLLLGFGAVNVVVRKRRYAK